MPCPPPRFVKPSPLSAAAGLRTPAAHWRANVIGAGPHGKGFGYSTGRLTRLRPTGFDARSRQSGLRPLRSLYIESCGDTSVGLGGRCLRVQRRNARGRRAIHGPLGGRCLSGHGPEGEHALRKRELAGRPASKRQPGRERRASAGSQFQLVRADPRRRVDQREARLGRVSSGPTEDHRRSPGRPRPPAAGTRGDRYAALLGEPAHVRKPRVLARHRTRRSHAALRCARREHGVLSDGSTADGARQLVHPLGPLLLTVGGPSSVSCRRRRWQQTRAARTGAWQGCRDRR